MSLRDALDRVSTLSRVPLAYSSDLLPLDRRVCVSADGVPVGAVLASLLLGTRVEASVVAGRVVLAPVAEHASSVGTLERVVVTGEASAAPRRALNTGVQAIAGDEIRQRSLTTLAQVVDAAAPGMWVWDRGPASLLAQYGSLRGASSFGSSAPKIYIDGIEAANPLLVSEIDPDVIDRVEVIRGPQGSALYGSDAIGGVINITTRHDGAQLGQTRLQLASIAGGSSSAYGASPVPTHDQRVAVRAGSDVRSLGLALEFGQLGAVVPASRSSALLVSGDARLVGSRATITTTGRFFSKHAGAGENPLISQIAPSVTPSAETSVATASATPPQSLQQYTLGTNVTLASSGRWTHSAVLGIDGYRLDHVASATDPFPLSVDSALRAAQGSGERATFRAMTLGRFGGDADLPATTIAFGVEHSVLRQRQVSDGPAAATTMVWRQTSPDTDAEYWNHNTGLFSRLSAEWRNTVYLTAGIRVERNDAFSGPNRYPLLPMLGLAVVRTLGPAELSLHSAFGKGIRPPASGVLNASRMSQRDPGEPAALDPESQSGVESGLALSFGRTFTMQATRFDQVASGLIQNVAVGVDSALRNGYQDRRLRYRLQNVGQIGNHGWELQSTLRRGSLALDGAVTLVDSRVRAIADGYMGDLRPDDRLLAVPARTSSLSASWTATRWFASLSATRAENWINYDRLALARAIGSGGGPSMRELVGSHLRAYWLDYDGQTRLRLTGSRELGRGIELLLTGDNLLGGQLGEPDNVTIRPGRTVTGGLRASF